MKYIFLFFLLVGCVKETNKPTQKRASWNSGDCFIGEAKDGSKNVVWKILARGRYIIKYCTLQSKGCNDSNHVIKISQFNELVKDKNVERSDCIDDM